MICPDGVDAALFKEYIAKCDLERILFDDEDWALYQQYESGMLYCRSLAFINMYCVNLTNFCISLSHATLKEL